MEHMILKLAYQQFNLHNNFAKRRFWQFDICFTRISVLVMCRFPTQTKYLNGTSQYIHCSCSVFQIPQGSYLSPMSHGVGEGDMTAGVGMNVVKTTGFKMEISTVITGRLLRISFLLKDTFIGKSINNNLLPILSNFRGMIPLDLKVLISQRVLR